MTHPTPAQQLRKLADLRDLYADRAPDTLADTVRTETNAIRTAADILDNPDHAWRLIPSWTQPDWDAFIGGTETEEPRIEEDADGTLDEFVAHNATVHFEAMDNNAWWIGVDLPDGRSWHINCGAENPKARTYARVEESN